MRVKLVRDDKNSNYKVSLKNIKKEKEFVKLLDDYNIEYKKTEYFKDFFIFLHNHSFFTDNRINSYIMLFCWNFFHNLKIITNCNT